MGRLVHHADVRPAALADVLPGRRLLQLTPLVAAALLLAVLRYAASYDVRDDPAYLALYLILGAAWVGVSIRWLAVTGISTSDDVVERANGSASLAVAGAIIGITLAYAGGNIGDGPGWWVVVFCRGPGDAGVLRGVDAAGDGERRLRCGDRGSRPSAGCGLPDSWLRAG